MVLIGCLAIRVTAVCSFGHMRDRPDENSGTLTAPRSGFAVVLEHQVLRHVETQEFPDLPNAGGLLILPRLLHTPVNWVKRPLKDDEAKASGAGRDRKEANVLRD